MKRLTAIALLLIITLGAAAQDKIYTKKARMADLPTRTTKVVLSGDALLEQTLRDEVSSRWRINPFEFCTVTEYEKLKSDNSLYFLRLVRDGGLVFLSYEKGGKDSETNRLKIPFEVARVPVASDGESEGDEFLYFGAFVDILQKFAEDSMISDSIGYAGLKYYNRNRPKSRKVESVDITVQPSASGEHAYRLIFAKDSHELFYISRQSAR